MEKAQADPLEAREDGGSGAGHSRSGEVVLGVSGGCLSFLFRQ